MGDRKVIQHYYSPEFDSSKLKKERKQQYKPPLRKVNMMLPVTFRCTKCGDYMGAGTKVNSRKEKAAGFEYLGIPSFRFYQRCRNCHSDFTFRTDPQHSCYVAESGVTAGYNPQKERSLQACEREPIAQQSAMEKLESRVREAKKELEKEDQLFRLLEQAKARERQQQVLATGGGTPLSDCSHQEDEEDEEAAIQAFASKIRRISE